MNAHFVKQPFVIICLPVQFTYDLFVFSANKIKRDNVFVFGDGVGRIANFDIVCVFACVFILCVWQNMETQNRSLLL